jgi:hypothetical protein
MKRGFANIFVMILFLIFIAFLIWQFILFQQEGISCQGDWSYAVNCPLGTYCGSLNQGSLAGGICRPYLTFLFESLNLRLPVGF